MLDDRANYKECNFVPGVATTFEAALAGAGFTLEEKGEVGWGLLHIPTRFNPAP